MASPRLMIALATLLLAATSVCLAANAQSPPRGAETLRLSGVVMVGTEARLAVIESAAGGARMVRAGETLADGSEVLEIGQDWVRLSTQGRDLILRLAGRPPRPQVAQGGPSPHEGRDPAEGPPRQPVVTLENRALAVFDAVAAGEDDSVEALGHAVGPLLDLPAGADIAFIGFGSGPFTGARAVKAALERDGMVQAIVSTAEGQEKLYLRLPNQDDPGGADNHPETGSD